MFRLASLPILSIAGLALTGASIATIAPARAKPVATASTPAAGATVASPDRIEIRLSEQAPATGANIALVMTAMPGMKNHGEMKVTGFKTEVAPDGMTLVAALPRALPAGTYRVTWTAGGGGGHYAFVAR